MTEASTSTGESTTAKRMVRRWMTRWRISLMDEYQFEITTGPGSYPQVWEYVPQNSDQPIGLAVSSPLDGSGRQQTDVYPWHSIKGFTRTTWLEEVEATDDDD